MKVKDVMTPRVIRVGPEEPAAVAARMLARYNVECAAGLRRKRENLRDDYRPGHRPPVCRPRPEPRKVPVRHIMTGRVVTVGADMSLAAAAEKWPGNKSAACRWRTVASSVA